MNENSKANETQGSDNIIETTFDDKVIVGSNWIKKSYPRSKGLYLVVEQVNGNEVAYSDATTNLRYAYVSKAKLLRDYDHLSQSDIEAM